MPRRGRWVDAGRGLLGLLRLAVCVVGIPVALVGLVATIVPGSGGVPWPQGIPSFDEVVSGASSPGQLPLSMLVKAVALIGWLGWLELSTAVLVDVMGRLREQSPRPLRLPLGRPSQALASRMVASAALITALWWQPPRTAGASTPAVAAVVSGAPRDVPPSAVEASRQPSPSTPGTKVHVVRPGDWLSKIAEAHLGSWRRYPEISALNHGRRQADGQALVDDDLIQPGWVLVMPDDAVNVDVVAPTPLTPPVATTPAPVETSEFSPKLAAPTASPPPTRQTSPTAAPTTEPNRSPLSNGTSGRPSPVGRAAVVGIPGIVAAAALRKLWCLRQAQQRRRPRGLGLPLPDPTLAPVEAKVRAVSTADAVEWVDLALRHLGHALRGEDGGPVPAIEAVRVGNFGVELLLDRTCETAPGGFVAADEGRVWRLGDQVELGDLRKLVIDDGPLLPALITAGTTPEGPVLIDLERAGTLSVEGDPDRVAAFLAGVGLEVATAPWASETSVRLIGCSERLAGLELVDVVEDPDAFIVEGWPPLDLGGAPTALAARVAPTSVEVLAPTVVVVAAGAASPTTISDLAALARTGSAGLTLVAPGPVAGATWRLTIEANGAAVLQPLGLVLACNVDRGIVEGLASLLAEAAEEEQGEVLATLLPDEVHNEAPHHPRAAGAPVVRVLGPIEVPWATRPARLVRSEEIVVYLSVHGARRVPRDRLRVAIHPIREDGRAGEVADSTFRAEVSRVRNALGKDREGRWYLPSSTQEGYVVEMRSDWTVFKSLVAAAHRKTSTEQIGLLREALELVRDRPFVDVPEQSYGWAWSEGLVSEIEIAVAEAAETLAELALADGELELSRWAARQGLLVIPSREDLHQAWMRAAAAAENWDDLDQAGRSVWRAVRSIDPLEEPRPETLRLYNELRQSVRGDGDAQGGIAPNPAGVPARG
ncbi:MAG: hypothetical protein ACRD1K_00845 [Acidimicrobiales bacterium]